MKLQKCSNSCSERQLMEHILVYIYIYYIYIYINDLKSDIFFLKSDCEIRDREQIIRYRYQLQSKTESHILFTCLAQIKMKDAHRKKSKLELP